MGDLLSYSKEDLVVFTKKEYCPHCNDVKKILRELKFEFTEVNATSIRPLFVAKHRTVPQVYSKGLCIGDANSIFLIYETYSLENARRIIIEGIYPK